MKKIENKSISNKKAVWKNLLKKPLIFYFHIFYNSNYFRERLELMEKNYFLMNQQIINDGKSFKVNLMGHSTTL